MIAMFATLVFATAGCAGSAAIGSSIRNALPALRRLGAQRKALASDPLALDRVYLITMIETPRHDGTLAPVPEQVLTKRAAGSRFVADPVAAKAQVKRSARVAARVFSPAKFHAAA